MKLLRVISAVLFLLASLQPLPAQEAPPQGLKLFYLGLLRSAPNLPKVDAAEGQKLQEEHLANIRRMAKAGKLMVAGPCVDNGELRGIFIFTTTDEKEIRELTKADPLIASGRLILELHPWWASEHLNANPSH